MSEIFDVALAYFEQLDWGVDEDTEAEIFRCEYEGDHGSWVCFGRARADINQFIFLSVLEKKTPKAKRILMAEYLTRANFGLNIGNFEMDFDDGEIRYKTSIDIGNASLNTDLMDPIVKANLIIMDDYLPGIKAVISGKKTPAEAVNMVREADEGGYSGE